VKQFARAILSSASLWLVIGTANVVLGVAIAQRVDGSRDAEWLWFWTRNWLQGTNPYRLGIPADYAPSALVALSPIGMVPDAIMPALWACTSVAIAIIVAWLGPKAMALESVPLRLSIGWFLSWAAVRYGLGNGQFALLVTACGLAAVWLARRGSNWSGLFLGLAFIKPHLGIAFLAWAIAAGRWRAICGAGAAIGAATLVFSTRLHENPLSVVAQYVRQVGVELGGPHGLRGAVEIRPLIEALIADPRVAGVVNMTLIVAGFAAIVWTLGRQPIEARERLALPLFCLLTLAGIFHNAYDLVLLWPVWLAVWDHQQRDQQRQPYLLAFILAALVLGIPGMWWQVRGPASGIALHFDRLLVAGVLIHLLATTARAGRRRSGRPSLWEPDGRDLVQAPARHSSDVMLP